MSFCQREAFHTQLSLIFDDEFIEAYTHGIVVLCCDGITRRFYPRLFTHSADYPEKYATILPFATSLSDNSNSVESYSPQFATEEPVHAPDVSSRKVN